ncbi:MAG: hypothetical protein QM736_10495 [Vicinamibacterales bacterium]
MVNWSNPFSRFSCARQSNRSRQVLDERLQVCRVGTVVPSDVLESVRPPRANEPFMQIAQDRIGHVDRVGDDRLIGRSGLGRDGRRCANRQSESDARAAKESVHGAEV